MSSWSSVLRSSRDHPLRVRLVYGSPATPMPWLPSMTLSYLSAPTRALVFFHVPGAPVHYSYMPQPLSRGTVTPARCALPGRSWLTLASSSAMGGLLATSAERVHQVSSGWLGRRSKVKTELSLWASLKSVQASLTKLTN